MKLQHILAILRQELFLSFRSVEVIIDIFFYPIVNIVVFGFLSLYLSRGSNEEAGQFVLMGMLMWQVVWITQYSVSLGSLWNIWSRNLSNLFIAPLQVKEYLFAQTLSGLVKAMLVLGLGAVLSIFLFDYNLFDMGLPTLILAFFNLAFFAFSIGIAIIGFIFYYGTRIQALAWGLVAIFQPLSAAFYPLSVMPPMLQYVGYLFPATFTFEAVRYSMVHGEVAWDLFGIAFAENLVYCVLGILFFQYLFNKSRDSGQFARNEA